MLRYPEFRRAVRVLCVLVVLLVLGVVAALVMFMQGAPSYGAFDAWLAQVKAQPGTTVAKRPTVLGTVAEVVENEREGISVETTQGPHGFRRITVTVPARERGRVAKLLEVPGTAVYFNTTDGGEVRLTNFNANVTRVRDAAGAAMIVALICATLLGGALAKDSDGHLPLVWTRPVSRTRYAIETMSISVATLIIAELLTAATSLLTGFVLGGADQGPDWSYAWSVPGDLLIPIAWYALLTAATASMRRGYAVIIGVAWACAFGVFAGSHASDAPAALTSIVGAINWVNPLHYVDSSAADAVRYAVALAALTIAYGATALFQWRRAEL